MRKIRLAAVLCVCVVLFSSGCATFRDDFGGAFGPQTSSNTGADKANVLFVFSHTKQLVGYDAIPKQVWAASAVRSFNDIFKHSIKELSNIENYTVVTETSADVEMANKRTERQELAKKSDFVIEVEIKKTESFARNFLGGLLSTVSLTIVPVAYPTAYEASVRIYDAKGTLIKSYRRTANITSWINVVMLFYYASNSPEKAVEEVYIDILRDVFRQIEAEKVLTPAKKTS